MSQRSVEAVIGRLATDEAFRTRFQADREAGKQALIRLERDVSAPPR